MTGEEIRLALRHHILDLLDETSFPEEDSFVEPVDYAGVHVAVADGDFYFRLEVVPVPTRETLREEP